MSTRLHTFSDIFDSAFSSGEEDVIIDKVSIPIIQRDYAQGREGPEVERVRNRFLESLYNAVTCKQITLDFIYGDIDENGVMTPLDGQQRLTTLFLLYWYAARKDRVSDEDAEFLHRFGYEVRPSARDFCSLLLDYTPSFNGPISIEIVNQYWFPYDWLKDPTVSSMLVMLNSIQERFSQVDGLWDKLTGGAISFYFLPIKDMGLTDDLYIKMNSRGKPLTQFEHFKAELESSLKKIDSETAKRIAKKIDGAWTDFLWSYRDDSGTPDDAFLRYFRFVCDIACYRRGDTPQGKSEDEFDMINEYFSQSVEDAKENIELMEGMFDCWLGIVPDEFFASLMSHEHENGKIRVESRYDIDLLGDCLRNYADVKGNGNRQFPLSRIALLYCVVTYLCKQDEISREQFAKRLRVVNNLVQNSEDELSDSESRSSGNRMPSILRQIKKLVQTGEIDTSAEKTLNRFQLNEEAQKAEWLESNPEQRDGLCELEDHPLLRGQISVIGLNKPEHFHRFMSLFECSRDKIDCALMSFRFYPQIEGKWRFQFGSGNQNRHDEAWRNLFHASNNKRFEETAKALDELLDQANDFDDELLDGFISDYLEKCDNIKRFDFRYYYIKYGSFRPCSYGKYSNSDFEAEPYAFSVMQTNKHWSPNTYQPFLKELEGVLDKEVSKEHYGQRIYLDDNVYLVANNASYCLMRDENEEPIKQWDIPQFEDEIDAIDRIEFMKAVIANTPEWLRVH